MVLVGLVVRKGSRTRGWNRRWGEGRRGKRMGGWESRAREERAVLYRKKFSSHFGLLWPEF